MMSWNIVDLPAPEGPTMATRSPGAIEKLRSSRTRMSGALEYEKATCLNSIAPRGGEGISVGFVGATMRGSTARSSAIRPAEPAAAETSFHTCDNSPSEVAASTANSTNCDRSPPLMRPAATRSLLIAVAVSLAFCSVVFVLWLGARHRNRDEERPGGGGGARRVIGAFDFVGETRLTG